MMEVDTPSSADSLSPRARILQRLAGCGVPIEYLEDLPSGLVCFVQKNDACIPEVVSAILPTESEAFEAINETKAGSKRALVSPTLKELYQESMVWLQWLMFREEPLLALQKLEKMGTGPSGICGAVWGGDDVAFRCRTCEHDSTCAICVPCFQNGNHKDHDFSIIHTTGGCCDCGDETAWKPEGFCSRHKGAGMIQPLPDDIAQSVGPVLSVLLDCWKCKLMAAESVPSESPRAKDHSAELRKVANYSTLCLVETFLEFCRRSESLLSLLSKKVITSAGLLDTLFRTERFLNDSVSKKLHVLILKLIGEPVFKYEFGKALVNYYPVFAQEAAKVGNDAALKKYPLLCSISVQILTVPTLTMRLVEEVNVLEVLLGCIGDILCFYSGEDGVLQVNRWSNLYDTTLRLLEDFKFVMSHSEVAEYLRNEQKHIFGAWLRILSFLQGMNPQKRETSILVEEENENNLLPINLSISIFSISSLLVARAFTVTGVHEIGNNSSKSREHNLLNEHKQIHATVGRMSEDRSACSSVGSAEFTTTSRGPETYPVMALDLVVPAYASLAYECLIVLDRCLVIYNTSNVVLPPGDISPGSFLLIKKALSEVRKGKLSFGLYDKHRSSVLQNQDCQPMDMCKMDIESSHDLVNGDNIMREDSTITSECFQVLGLSDWKDINYDVSSAHISIHIPLHGLLSSILKEDLKKYYADSAILYPAAAATTCPDLLTSFKSFFGNILRGCQPYGFSSFMMEHPLQIKVFCAQVRAGMWRRNGDAATFYYDMYRDVHWSANSLELNLFLLQICAAFAPPDQYIRRILDRFGLLSYVSLDLQHSSEFEPVLVQEMLTLIIQIVKERRYCGFTASENVRRELVCKLATGDAARSHLQKSLPRDLSKLNLQEVLDQVAQYTNPSGMKQGRYSLQLSCWKELDLYHPRWSPRDLQVAEEKYLQFCGVSAMTSQLPKWTKIYEPLIGLSRIATCNMVLGIIRAVLFYAVHNKLAQSHAPDGVLITALHLLSLGLDICTLQTESGQVFPDGEPIPLLSLAGEDIHIGSPNTSDHFSLLSLLTSLLRINKNENLSHLEVGNFKLSSLVESLLKKFALLDSDCASKFKELAPDVFNRLFQLVQDNGTNVSTSASDAEARKAKARQRQAAILEKMRAAQSKFLENVAAETENEAEGSKAGSEEQEGSVESDETCSLCHDSSSKAPVSFFALLQKSRLFSFVDRGPLIWDQDCQLDKGKAQENVNMMKEPSECPKIESPKDAVPLSELKQLVRDVVEEFSREGCPAEVEAFADYLNTQVSDVKIPSVHDNCRTKTTSSLECLEENLFTSIQKEMVSVASALSTDDDSMDYLLKDMPKSIDIDTTILGKYLASLPRELSEVSSASNDGGLHNEPNVQATSYDGFGPRSCDGVHLSSCGHAVHQRCLERYLSSLKERHSRRMIFEGGHIVDPDQGEFLCPVCRRLVNSVLPAEPRDKRFQQPVGINRGSMFPPNSLVSNSNNFSISFRNAIHLLKSAASVISSGEILKAYAMPGRDVMPDVEPFFEVLCRMYFPVNKDAFLSKGRVSLPLVMWDTLKYSLVSTEIAARQMSGTNSMSGYSSFDSELNSSGDFILSLILRLVQRARSKSSADMFLRFRSIMLFAASICGADFDRSFGCSIRQEGKVSRILKHVDSNLLFPDTQFWKRSSDPIISRDSFSTLMWILFCLPCQFMLQKESLYSLVHMFYAVTITQGVVAYCVRHGSKMEGLGSGDCLVSDIAKLVAESGIAHEHFVCDYIDPSCGVKDFLRSFSLPFLRRCAFLSKVLNRSTTAQFLGTDCSFETSFNVGDGLDTSSCQVNLDEVSKLENIFEFPSLDAILEDKLLRSLVRKWIHHFHEKFDGCNNQPVLHLTPAVPFQLMRLPSLYQDLFQRYIKPRCHSCNKVVVDPALCLLCGKLCSTSWKSCCSESGCQSHAVSCGSGTGVFLLVKNTGILLQRNARQAVWPSPYLDAFGEEDPEMRRGKPLYLNEDRYYSINYLVASHGLDRSSKVLHRTTTTTFFLA